jgi:hypothetical protein
VELFQANVQGLSNIPNGKKENKFYIMDNARNNKRRADGNKNEFADDCGTWASNRGTGPKTAFLLTDGKLKNLFVKESKYSVEKVVNRVRTYVPLEPQPDKESIVVIQRSYVSLKADTEYKRCVNWVEQAPRPSS